MILTLFLALIAIAVVVCILGYFTGDEPYLTVGLFFLFLLSVVIATGNLEYETGATITTSTIGNSTVTGIEYTYTPWDDSNTKKFGWGLGAITLIGSALSFYHTRQRRIDANE